MTVKTRFAPSPTGYLHIGGARTALFCWLYARRHGGRFVLRIEDTDRERSTPEAINAILEGMAWLGLDYDEGPFYQTQRFDRYREVLDRMLAEGTAYRCYCSRQRLEQLREAQLARKEKPRYDGRCRDLDGPPADAEGEPVVRFRQPREGMTVVDDRVKGRVAFQNSELDDLIIARADGTPTYNFVVVVDDMDMAITHVIRGDDHLNNTARQANILQALGVTPPVYAHVPMILDEHGKKLSKRTGAASVMDYRDQGFLPEAVVNYLVRLGWAHGDQEIFTLDEMVEHFDIGDINHSASSLNPSKLEWLNQHYLKTLPPAHVARHLAWHLGALGIDPTEGPDLEAIVAAQAERSRTLVEMAENSRFFFREPEGYDEKAARKHLGEGSAPVLAALRLALGTLESWTAEAIHAAVQGVADEQDLKLGKVAQPLRVAVSGGPVSPPIDVTLALLGRESTLRRIEAAEAHIRSTAGA
ncbi:glutamate--tRNA ligase [Sediminicurvatus halobius]|uniref:Glutamate--tRNA ligase n=1 Tax=Sediminicurvatus halobius TaxID=2182432 RepID=A0A2U2MZT4_9GAMM|nr:glutamate--tRNA ligase [Spiribacter halobius]PWG62322.1 glutamate--tRNA ligase [Spiribacter halobius]UEX79757.1 glutamate--tRNA ligase [Spiribacter halobius]